MKKFFSMIIFALILMSFSFYNLIAEEFRIGTTIVPGNSFSPSMGVTIKVKSTSTAYTMTSAHKQGKKEYATTNKDEIKSKDCGGDPCGNNAPTDPQTAGTLPSGF